MFGHCYFQISVAATDLVNHFLLFGGILERNVVCKLKPQRYAAGNRVYQSDYAADGGKSLADDPGGAAAVGINATGKSGFSDP